MQLQRLHGIECLKRRELNVPTCSPKAAQGWHVVEVYTTGATGQLSVSALYMSLPLNAKEGIMHCDNGVWANVTTAKVIHT